MYITDEFLDLQLRGPLDTSSLVIHEMEIHERACAPYTLTLHMHSTNDLLHLEGLVGQMLFTRFQYGERVQYYNGIVGEIEQGSTIQGEATSLTNYRAKLYPPFWRLKFSQDHQIFQNLSALEIIMDLLQKHNICDVVDKTTRIPLSREYCVQYGESYFDFICRLMEEEGISYIFEHTSSKTTMILLDSGTPPHSLDLVLPLSHSEDSNPRFDYIQSLRDVHQVVPQSYASADYNFETASTKLYTKVKGKGEGLEVYRYPGLFQKRNAGDNLSTLRIQELEWFRHTIKGVSTAPKLSPLGTFKLIDHPRLDMAGQFRVYEVTHHINMLATEKKPLYHNSFEAFPIDIPFQPPLATPKPRIYSTQTATVTGKVGEEIWCDAYGRVKVQFHWDQKGQKDDKSSCWIRVAQLWAGSNWGGLWTPRVGMEVVVTFLEGDPDRPLITGCVYNSDNKPMYAEKEPTKSTLKSRSSKAGAGFNEIRFDDKKNKEEIYIHAQKEMNTVVEETRTLQILRQHDKTDIMCGNREVTLHGNDNPQNPSGGNDKLILVKGKREVILQGQGNTSGDHCLLITKGNNLIEITQGNMAIQLDLGNFSLSAKGMTSIKVEGPVSIEASDISLKAQGILDISAGGALHLSSGEGIQLKAPLIKLN